VRNFASSPHPLFHVFRCRVNFLINSFTSERYSNRLSLFKPTYFLPSLRKYTPTPEMIVRYYNKIAIKVSRRRWIYIYSRIRGVWRVRFLSQLVGRTGGTLQCVWLGEDTAKVLPPLYTFRAPCRRGEFAELTENHRLLWVYPDPGIFRPIKVAT